MSFVGYKILENLLECMQALKYLFVTQEEARYPGLLFFQDSILLLWFANLLAALLAHCALH